MSDDTWDEMMLDSTRADVVDDALDAVVARILEQQNGTKVGSLEWRAHMADLMHVADVRKAVIR